MAKQFFVYLVVADFVEQPALYQFPTNNLD
jgi:hypothetical protein